MDLPAVPTPPDRASAGSGVAVLLRRAEPLRTVYQPIVDLRSGEVAGYEALTRVVEWPARSPEPWFAAADREGLGAALEAAALASALRARPLLDPRQFLAVNVTASALLHRDVTSALLGEGDLSGVVVAVSEAEAADAPQLAAVLAGLREHGLLVAVRVVDGGRAELRRLADLRPDLVELGSDLVHGVAGDQIAARVVRLVLAVAADLGADVLAAGVEALVDARWLQAAGVALGEGWLFGRARAGLLQPSPEVVAWLRSPDAAG
ncbi:EAL domain-containing protein [Kineosporia sp. A_224]|uniref:EAL domain-containing protein n=1 Tax=Kineosporia sp. A_224 TaxID=1962180 RepID=UPI0013045F1B|nr:EAL domain-containing protein [Kineosporia sp. A_224]